MNNERKIIDSVETLESALASLKEAEKKFSTYTQEQVDKIFLAAAIRRKQGENTACKDGGRRDRHGRC